MDKNALIYGYTLSGPDKGVPITVDDVARGVSKEQCTWLHFDYTHPDAISWIEQQSALDPVVINALLSEETRPRATALKGGVLLSLRGVNLAAGSDPEDMVAIRVWVDEKRVISTRKRSLLSAQDIAALIDAKEGPETPGEFVAMLADRLIARMQETIQDTEDKVAEIEEKVLTAESYSLRSEIADLRRQAISLRRYLAPQREAMLQLLSDKMLLFSADDHVRLRETTDHLIRYIEDLDSVRDRAAVTQEELVNRLSEQLNNRMYVLSIVAAIFLPLGFFTGLLGINVGGIPGADNSNSFMIFILFLVVIVSLQVWLFKVKRWF
ncbi:zinc transporter ZntB [Alkalimarinus alittae]|uniref:Zinc transporter ZntB n=1 Tax=Alkalimarinus alittae TaxID=2961619 RepID=A0ABY6MZY7_9ALTE|nr:zinc transporter ZntB [Alkalimarinus alittae]UZE95399.1 zinc transporter ZntB [Alkalimarinus alittae]